MKRLWIGFIGLIVLSLLVFAPTAHAGVGRSGVVVVIAADETVPDDLYVFARKLVIQGHVRGDVYALAQTVQIQGTVDGDVVSITRILDITGRVEDDVRAGAMLTRIGGAGVGDDVMLTGVGVNIEEHTPIGGDLYAGTYQIRCAGDVAGNVLIAANAVELAGTIGGNVKVNVGEPQRGPSPLLFLPEHGIPIPQVAPGLTITRNAVIRGDVQYLSVEEAAIEPGAHINGHVRHIIPTVRQQKQREEHRFGSRAWVRAQSERTLSRLLVGLLLFLLAPGAMRTLALRIRQQPAASFGWGIALFLGFIATLFFVLLSGIILALGFKLLALSSLSLWSILLTLATEVMLVIGYFAYTTFVVPVLVPYAALSRVDRGGWWWIGPMLIGLLIYILLTGLPYVGWLFNILFILVGLGALVLLWRQRTGSTSVPS